MELSETHLQLKEDSRSHEERVKQLKGEVARVTSQLEATKQLCNKAWSHRYSLGLERVRDYLVANPNVAPETLNLAHFTPS